MNMMEIERALRTLRLSGIRATLDTRIMQAQARRIDRVRVVVVGHELALCRRFQVASADLSLAHAGRR
jgi:hypothetical protein